MLWIKSQLVLKTEENLADAYVAESSDYFISLSEKSRYSWLKTKVTRSKPDTGVTKRSEYYFWNLSFSNMYLMKSNENEKNHE